MTVRIIINSIYKLCARESLPPIPNAIKMIYIAIGLTLKLACYYAAGSFGLS